VNFEALAQISDTVSFCLVTPEFLGEKRLTEIRSRLRYLLDYINKIFSTTNTNLGFILSIAFMISAIATTPLIAVGEYLGEQTTLGHTLFIVGGSLLLFIALPIGVPFFLLLTALVFLLNAEKIAVRGAMFSIGAALFFITRALSTWHTMRH
jgi:hypothetical protein